MPTLEQVLEIDTVFYDTYGQPNPSERRPKRAKTSVPIDVKAPGVPRSAEPPEKLESARTQAEPQNTLEGPPGQFASLAGKDGPSMWCDETRGR